MASSPQASTGRGGVQSGLSRCRPCRRLLSGFPLHSCWGSSTLRPPTPATRAASPSLLAVARLGGGVQVLDGGSGAQLAAWAGAGEQRGADGGEAAKVVGLHFLGSLGGGGGAGLSAAEAAAEAQLRALSISGGGRVSVHTAGAEGAPWQAGTAFQAAPSVAATVSGLNEPGPQAAD